ncbi:hypothetical protein F4553_002055 [Allocatelliglobosispora scoriae]|uniref:Uncharacterized protein n=1 Tax=Allocatelliglobosispora scoriae TaxID=643052 RepID=A0A841BN16_9ACTN|nr:hypothetical protein [Allocatelliglobosispora scoriae]MBB5868676.1 hypothetical protein [Allocatelliglobosispora scoriae]
MRRILGGMTAALLILLFAPAIPAHAVSERHEQTSTTSLVQDKSATVACAGNKIVVGVGAYISGGNGGVALTGVVPAAGLGSVTAYANAQANHSTPWSVTVFAVCRYQPNLGTERVAAAAVDGNTATATCTANKVVVSTGFRINGALGGGKYLTGILPSADISSVAVTSNIPATAASPLYTFALCAWPQPQSWQRTRSAGLVTATATKTGLADPPAMQYGWAETFGGGAVITGTGAALIDGFGANAALEGTFAHASRVAGSSLATVGSRSVGLDSGEWGVDTYGDWIGAWYAAES